MLFFTEKALGSKPRVLNIPQILPFRLLDHDGGHISMAKS